MRYFPANLGFVFHISKSNKGRDFATPYEKACERFVREKVTKIVLDSISDCCPSDVNVDTLLLSLSTDEAFDMDGLYLFLRKDPAAFLMLLHGGVVNAATMLPLV